MAAGVACRTIDLLFEFPTLNGGERSMLSVLPRLAKRTDLTFRALCPGTGPLADALRELQIPRQNFAVRDSEGHRRPLAELIAELTEFCRRRDVSVLHANSLAMSRLSGQLSQEQLPAEVIRTGHLRDIIRLSRSAVADLNNNDGLVAVSEATRSFHVQQGLQHSGSRCVVIHNGIDTDRFQPRDRAALRAELFPDIPAHDVIVLNVGQICLRKGQSDVARAVVAVDEMLAASGSSRGHATGKVHLVIAGERHSAKDESVAFEREIRRTFAAAERSEQLHMPGNRCDVHLLMNAADLLVHAARQEPFGRVLLEASASGLPIIATDVGGTRELLRPDVDALLVPAKQPDALAAAVRRLIESPARAANLAASARRRTTEHFTVDRSADALAEFWVNVRRC